jgi:hypothetical protein
VAQRPEVQRIDPRGQPVPDRMRFDAERATHRLVLVLDVAEDQCAVAVGHHPQADHLDRAAFASARSAEEDHVRVGHARDSLQRPADRVGVERTAGQEVDANLRTG